MEKKFNCPSFRKMNRFLLQGEEEDFYFSPEEENDSVFESLGN